MSADQPSHHAPSEDAPKVTHARLCTLRRDALETWLVDGRTVAVKVHGRFPYKEGTNG